MVFLSIGRETPKPVNSVVHDRNNLRRLSKGPMRTYSYENILRAVGQVLDRAEARSFAIRDVESGLVVETFDDTGKRALTLNFDVADLAELVDRHMATSEIDALDAIDDASRYDLAYVEEESALKRLLKRRELIGAGL